MPEPSTDRSTVRPEGQAIVLASYASNAVLAICVVPAAFGHPSLQWMSVGVSMLSFLVAIVVWTWALVLAAVRTTRGDDVQVASLFLIQGVPEGAPRRTLYWAFLQCVLITAVVAASDPFVVLAPMLPLGLVGLWGARHGVYPARQDAPARPRPAAVRPDVSAPPAGDPGAAPDEEG